MLKSYQTLWHFSQKVLYTIHDYQSAFTLAHVMDIPLHGLLCIRWSTTNLGERSNDKQLVFMASQPAKPASLDRLKSNPNLAALLRHHCAKQVVGEIW